MSFVTCILSISAYILVEQIFVRKIRDKEVEKSFRVVITKQTNIIEQKRRQAWETNNRKHEGENSHILDYPQSLRFVLAIAMSQHLDKLIL